MQSTHKIHTWVEISASALNHNLAQYKRVIGVDRIIAPVIKSNAYGHGMSEVAHLCERSLHVGWFCLALLSDALFLREQGITKPIFILGCVDTDPASAINKNIDFLLYDFAFAQRLNEVGKKRKFIFNVHVKIDTGLSRMGVCADDAFSFIQVVQKLPYVKVNGIYSHFAESQEEDTAFTEQQRGQFEHVIAQLKTNNIEVPLRHIANSAATTRFDLTSCNFFRVGVGVYGLWPSDYIKKITQEKYPWFTLKPVLSWKTRIVQIKRVPADSFVGYSRTHRTNRQSMLAIFPIGYYDGYDLQYSNTGSVRIGDRYAQIVGRVCMNHTIVDVTDMPQVRVGDEVLLMGDEDRVSVYRFATLNGNNNVREVLTNIYPHVKRIVVD